MEFRLIEKTRHTLLKVSRSQYPIYKKLIESYIAMYGGRKTKQSSRFLYFEVDADLLNRKALEGKE